MEQLQQIFTPSTGAGWRTWGQYGQHAFCSRRNESGGNCPPGRWNRPTADSGSAFSFQPGALQDAGLPLLGFSCSAEFHLFACWRQGSLHASPLVSTFFFAANSYQTCLQVMPNEYDHQLALDLGRERMRM